ncbi:MAG: sugar phosphate isomerase/epimerase [Thermoguttaceae bacterium]|nr:sugar phosphate isomerase/epimerase [Thermoguttaceae bacterium]MDW8077724.1 sugar phosphate isomerase/epimerase family protein [Thermoguttaceae bacterium]
MSNRVTRRTVLGTAVASVIGHNVASLAYAVSEGAALKKSLIGVPNRETLEAHKAAGFEGIESHEWDIDPDRAAEMKKIADQLEMKIHSVMRGWTNFNAPDQAVVEKDIASVERSILAAAAFGADVVLLVPCRVSDKDMAIPAPWEFDIEFDERTGYVKRVVAGDNSRYVDYIKAHNHAIDTSRRAVEKLIPVAERNKVIIALENVWNNLWVKPKIFAHFVASFASPWVQAYYDIGNHVRYAPPEEWLRALGKLIVRIHVKDFLLNPDGKGGKFVPIREGSVNWPSVRRVIDEIGYRGWMTIEGSGELSLTERSHRLDLIIAGK